MRGKSENAQSQGRALKPGGLARIGEISSAENLMEMLVEFSNKFRCHSAPGMAANKIFQLVLLAGHYIYEFDTIDVLNWLNGVSIKASVLWKELVMQIVHIETAIIYHDL